MLDNLKEDTRRLKMIKSKAFPWYVIESLLFETGYQAVVLYRIAHWFKSRRVPVLGPLFARLGQFLTGVDISPGAVIGPGLRLFFGALLAAALVTGGEWARQQKELKGFAEIRAADIPSILTAAATAPAWWWAAGPGSAATPSSSTASPSARPAPAASSGCR